MNTLVIVAIAAVCLLAGYTLYGRWLTQKKMEKIMYRQMDGWYLLISFLPSQVQAL